jgi:hypothetical protein
MELILEALEALRQITMMQNYDMQNGKTAYSEISSQRLSKKRKRIENLLNDLREAMS